MAIFETVLKSDLKKPVQVKQLTGNLFSADNGGNKITAEVMDGGSAATLSGLVTGYIIRADDATVTVEGTLSGNKASIILPASAYVVVGRVSIVIKIGTTTLAACTAYVYRTTTDVVVDPGTVVPSIAELLALIDDCEAATTAAMKVANLTVSAEEASGSTPDAILSETGSGDSAHKHITFKLVKGPQGQTGPQGTSYYVHFRYAESQPTQDSDMKTTPDEWIGIYSGTSQTAPTTYTSYTWYQYKGDTGATGQGAYVHIRWSEDEPTSDSDIKTTPDEWIGIYSGSSSTAPTTYSSYTWYKVKGETGSPGTGSFSDKTLAIPLSGWSLSSGYYQYTYTDSDITAGTVVTVDFGDDIRDGLAGDLIYTVSTGSVLFKTDLPPIGTVNLILHLAVAVTSASGNSF